MLSKKKVKFNLMPEIILESPDEREYLHFMRISDFDQRKADKLRMEKMLTPILDSEFRNKMYKKIQNYNSR